MSTPRDLYQEVTDRIVAALEAGVAPWVPSHTEPAGPAALPRNGFSRMTDSARLFMGLKSFFFSSA